MICEQISPFYDGELDPAGEVAFREHLITCERCQQALHACIQQEMIADLHAQDERDGALGSPRQKSSRPDSRTSKVDVRKIESGPKPAATGVQTQGEQLLGLFSFVSRIEASDTGTVFHAKDAVGRDVAIKVMNAAFMSDLIAVQYLARQSVLATRLDHPNAARILDVGLSHDDALFLVMELVTGETLDAVIEREGPLAPTRAIQIAIQICDALDSAHAIGIIHRDLKPANIKLAEGDVVKVSGFELSGSVFDREALEWTVGSPAYMAPEVITGGAIDTRADIYSLGCTLYQAVSGRAPFQGIPSIALPAMHVAAKPPPLVGVPLPLATLIEALLAKTPADRPSIMSTRYALQKALRELE